MRIMVRSKETGEYVEAENAAIEYDGGNEEFYCMVNHQYAIDEDDRLIVCADNGFYATVDTEYYDVTVSIGGKEYAL